MSTGFSRQEYWSGLPCPLTGDLPNPGIEPRSPALWAGSFPLAPPVSWALTVWVHFHFSLPLPPSGFPAGSDGKASAWCGRPGFDPWVGKIPWGRKWQPIPVLLPGKFHGRRRMIGYSPRGHRVGHDWAASLPLPTSLTGKPVLSLTGLQGSLMSMPPPFTNNPPTSRTPDNSLKLHHCTAGSVLLCQVWQSFPILIIAHLDNKALRLARFIYINSFNLE